MFPIGFPVLIECRLSIRYRSEFLRMQQLCALALQQFNSEKPANESRRDLSNASKSARSPAANHTQTETLNNNISLQHDRNAREPASRPEPQRQQRLSGTCDYQLSVCTRECNCPLSAAATALPKSACFFPATMTAQPKSLLLYAYTHA